MKKADIWFIVIVLLIVLAVIFLVMNNYAIFPTPPAEELAKSVIPVQ